MSSSDLPSGLARLPVLRLPSPLRLGSRLDFEVPLPFAIMDRATSAASFVIFKSSLPFCCFSIHTFSHTVS